jgi:hypothetical protein
MKRRASALAGAAVAVLAVAACGGTSTPATPTPAPEPSATAADVQCAHSLIVGMRAGLNYASDVYTDTAVQRQDQMAAATACEPVVTAHGEGLDPAVWALTAAAGYPRSRWNQ